MKVILVLCGVALVARLSVATAQSDFDDPEMELPPSMNVCYRDAPDLGKCIKNTIQGMLPELQTGIESLGFPPIDPFEASITKLDHYISPFALATMQLEVKKAKTFGMSQANIQNVRVTATDMALTLDVDIRFPRIVIEGFFKADSVIYGMSLVSKGFFNTTLTHVTTTWQMAGQVTERNGEEYLEIKSFDMTPRVGNMKIYSSSIHPTPSINKLVLDAANFHWPIVFDQLLPGTRSGLQPVMVDLMNKIFLRVPYRRLLPTLNRASVQYFNRLNRNQEIINQF